MEKKNKNKKRTFYTRKVHTPHCFSMRGGLASDFLCTLHRLMHTIIFFFLFNLYQNNPCTSHRMMLKNKGPRNFHNESE